MVVPAILINHVFPKIALARNLTKSLHLLSERHFKSKSYEMQSLPSLARPDRRPQAGIVLRNLKLGFGCFMDLGGLVAFLGGKWERRST